MDNKKIVPFVLDTYNLPPKLRERIERIALRRIDELALSGFDAKYTYIDHLVDRFTQPFVARATTELDALVKGSSKRTHHDVIGKEDEGLLSLLEDEEEIQPEQMPIEQAIEILGKNLDESEIRIFQALISNLDKNVRLSWTPEELRIRISDIRERIGYLKRKFEVNGRIIIPRRPIAHIRLNPTFRIIFGRRQFHGDPLAFYLANKDVYEGMSRTELAYFDISLYRNLNKHGQLGQAVPYILVADRRIWAGYESPLHYYRVQPEDVRSLGRKELARLHRSIFDALSKAGQLDEATQVRKNPNEGKFRGFDTGLAFYEAHKGKYRGLSRTELFEVDDYLYKKLNSEGTMNLAIPEKRKTGPKKRKTG